MIVPQEILTGIAVFTGTILGGIIVAEYSLRRGKNMITKSLREALTTLPIMDFAKQLLDMQKPRKETSDHYE